MAFCLCSCNTYRQNILFTTEEDVIPERFNTALYDAEKNYVFQPNDYLSLEVFTNKGERIIDPDFELLPEGQGNQTQNRPNPDYLIQENGIVELPLIGEIKLAGLTLSEANELLSEEFAAFYKDPYVLTQYLNKRVIVLGATGGKVIPFVNENYNLLEVLALAGGLDNNAKGGNIRVIRGDLADPEVRIIDLNTIDGLKAASLDIFPGDVVYVEPIRRVVSESIRDFAPVLSAVSSVLTLIIVIQNL